MAAAGITAGHRVLVTGASGGFGAPTVNRLRKRAAAGHFDTSPIAAGLVRRLTGRDVTAVRPTPAPSSERSSR